jgi:long-subunit acyl-CoA synthetase (AMP-forming)
MNTESFLANIEESLRNHWKSPALTDFNGEIVTYGQVAHKIARLHIAFEIFRLDKGEKVAIAGRNSSNWGISFLAAVTYGAVAVPILHEFTPENIHHIVNHSESKLLFVGKYNLDSLDLTQMSGLETVILLDDYSVIKSGYGMTECGPIITYESWARVPLFSCGKAAPGMEIKIDSLEPEKIPGEILTRSDNLMLGYYKNPEATQDAIFDGWFHTGDLGIIDKNGYLYIKWRSKNMLIGANGQNIYPEEIENRLNNAKYILESIVYDSHGKIVALVYPDYDTVMAENLSADELNEKLDKIRLEINTQLPAYSRLARIKIYPEEFEKTPKKSIKRYLYTNV